MCGIIGYVGTNGNALPVLINGLECLEYRGYDSAGVAFLNKDDVMMIKAEGKLNNLKAIVNQKTKTNLGIGHTRWATHGGVNVTNCHPHQVDKITLVHNGIIENYSELRKDLIIEGYTFKSETDTEVAAAIINKYYQKTGNMLKALSESLKILKGSFALNIICSDDLQNLYAVKKESPLIVGIGNNENYIASDVPAILKYTKQYQILEDGEIVKLNNKTVTIYDKNLKIMDKEIKTFAGDLSSAQKEGFDHFMLKEIYEQPEVFKKTTSEYTNNFDNLIAKMPDFNKYERIDIVACGSAMHAGLVGKSLIENYANVPVNVEIASEYRYKKLFLNDKVLVILVSQSGETADTLAALKIAKQNGSDTLAIVNVEGSSIARSADHLLYIKAGIEIAVATTKAYSAQVTMLGLIALNIASSKNLIEKEEVLKILKDIKMLPNQMNQVLNNNLQYKDIAKDIAQNEDIFFIGRGVDYAVAMEGSLKLKEISYVHSEAYPAGELKHGTISLINKDTPVFSLITETNLKEKTISNIKEVKSRGAKIITITNEEIDDDFSDKKVIIPKTNPFLQPLLEVIPLQLISYEVAKLRNCDIDKPKNLAKSVTVE